MNRVVVLGRGGAGKSALARALGERTGLPVVEVDKHFWQEGLRPMTRNQWIEIQTELAAADQWIMDGDLGPYDELWVRLRRADTIVLLEPPLTVCAWRVMRRGPEAADFWRWMLSWRRKSRPILLAQIAAHAPGALVRVLHSVRDVRGFLNSVGGDALPLR